MNNKRYKALYKLIAFVMAGIICVMSCPVSIYADDETPGTETVFEAPDETVETEEPTEPEEVVRDLAEEEFLELTSEDIEAKLELFPDLEAVSEGVPDEDYEKDTLICQCDSEEAANEIAQAYSEATEIDISVDSYAYGVAVLKVSEYADTVPAVVNGETIEIEPDPVQALVEIAASADVDLPALYPEAYVELCSVNPDNEIKNDSFDDEYLTNYKGPGLGADTEYYEWYHDTIGSKFLWKAEEGGAFADPSDVVVAIIDSGMRTSHEDFAGVNIVGAKTIIGGTETDYVTDVNGHGTNVAGIIAATAGNQKGGRGIATSMAGGGASSVSIMPIRVTSDSGSIKRSDVVRAINYVIEQKAAGVNVAVINMSLGGANNTSVYNMSVTEAIDSGIVVCAAAGNSNSDMPFYPADVDGVIKVASVNSSLEKSAFSNYGSLVDISAPGGEYRVDANYGSYRNEGLCAPNTNTDNKYSRLHGTSQAAPVVSAVAALIRANETELSPQAVLDRIKETATPIDSGYQLGAGVVNAAAALGIDDTVPAPQITNAKYENGTLSFDITEDNNDGVIYYTIDGTTPDPDNVNETDINEDMTGTRIYKAPVSYTNTDVTSGRFDVTVKAVTLLYSRTGPAASYTVSHTEKKVSQVELTGRDDIHELTIGATLQLTATALPLTAVNRTVTYESSDPSRVSVDKNGKITAINHCKTDAGGNPVPVVITATATDGSGCSDTYEIVVTPKATDLIITAPLQTDTTENGKILLRMSENEDTYTYDLSDKWVIYPSSASHHVVYTTSNKNVLTVDSAGIVTAHSTGPAKVTVTAADGSGVKDTINFVVQTPMYSLQIKSSTGENRVIATKNFTPVAVMNNGESTPDVKKLKWEITQGAEYASIRNSTGVVTAGRNSDIGYSTSKTVRIKAVSDEYGIESNELELSIIPVTESITVTEQPEIVENKTGNIFSYIAITPSRYSTLNTFEYKSSDTRVLQVDKNGKIYAIKAGAAKVTIKALDGSNKSASVKVSVVKDISKISITNKNSDGIEVITPGRTLSFGISASDSAKVDNKYVEWSGTDNPYTQVSSGKLSYIADKERTQALRDRYNEYPTNPVRATVRAKYTPNNITASADIYVYPDRVSSIYFPEASNPYIREGTLYLSNIGAYTGLYPDTLPANTSFNLRFKYTSGNTKVAVVNEYGQVRAVENGKTYITVKALDGSNKTVKLPVVVSRPPKAVRLLPETDGAAVLSPGKSLQFDAMAYADTDCTKPAGNTKVSYSLGIDATDRTGNPISLDGIASITQKGKLTVSRTAAFSEGLKVIVTASAVEAATVAATYDVMLQPAVTSLNLSSVEIPDIGVEKKITVGTERVSVSGNVLMYDKVRVKIDSTPSGTGILRNYKLTVKNEKLADASFEEGTGAQVSSDGRIISSENSPVFTVTAKASGRTVVTVESLDGSGKKVNITVTCVVPVTSVAAVSPLDIYNVDGGKRLQLSALLNMPCEEYEKSAESGTSKAASFIKSVNKLCTNQSVSWYFVNDAGQLSSENDYATLNSKSGVLTAKKVGYEPQTVKVAVRSNDIAGVVSQPIEITINPSAVYVTHLSVKTKTDIYDLGYGSSLAMVAFVNGNATDKRIVWSADLVDESGNVTNNIGGVSVDDVIDTKTLEKKGVLKSKITNTIYTVRITATSVGISDAMDSHISDSCDITLYPKIYSIRIETYPTENVKEILKNTNIVLKADGYGYDRINTPDADWKEVCNKYRVTYTGDCAKVFLLDDSGCEVRVVGHKKGTVTVTFTALDGSAKRASYRIKVTEPKADASGLVTVDNRKYYIENGAVYTGFKMIDDKLYYFNERENAKGALADNGFFTLPDTNEYYVEGDSNRYYALPGGEVYSRPGWATVKLNTNVTDSQKWSYYFNYTGVDGDEEPSVKYQESVPLVSVVCGDVTIDDNGTVRRDATLNPANRDIFYSFDAVTGARKRAVLYFYGNYHGAAIENKQINTIDSLSRFVNTNEKYDEASEVVIYANSENPDEIKRVFDSGLISYDPDITVATESDGSIYPKGWKYAKGTVFPRAASSHVEDEAAYTDYDKRVIAESGKVSKAIYRVEDDIAAASVDGTYALVKDGADKDGNLDAYDEQAYSYELYRNAISKYGPNNLALVGASSGGGTCLALVKMARDNGLPQPDIVILYSPWLDVATDNPEAAKIIGTSSGGFADLPTLRYWGARYTRDAAYTEKDDEGNIIHPYGTCAGAGVDYDFASPVNYSKYANGEAADTLSHIVSDIYIYTGSLDFCMPDCKIAGKLATAANVNLTLDIVPNMPHGYMFEGGTYYKQAKKTMLESSYFITTQKGAVELN